MTKIRCLIAISLAFSTMNAVSSTSFCYLKPKILLRLGLAQQRGVLLF